MTTKHDLRPVKLSDAAGYYACHQDKEAKAAFRSTPDSIEAAKKELQENLKQARKGLNQMFAIEVDGEFAGYVNLRFNDHPTYKHSVIIGYGIHKEFRGKGIASAAVKKVTALAFKKQGIKRVYGYTRSYNKASARVLEKAGYKLEGTLKKNKFMNGKYVDDMVWAKVR